MALTVSHLPPWFVQTARRYVAWSERGLKQGVIELQFLRTDLRQWEVRCPPGMEILPLPEAGDEWLLRDTYNAGVRDLPGARPARIIDIIAFASAPHHDPQGIFLARAGNHYIGTCVGRLRNDGAGRIYSLSVHREYRTRGVGRALMTRTLRYLQERGAREIRLQVAPSNTSALRLYRSLGFGECSTELLA